MNSLVKSQHFHPTTIFQHLAIGDRGHRVPIHENHVHARLKGIHQGLVFLRVIPFPLKVADSLLVELYHEIRPFNMSVHHAQVSGQGL